MLIAEKCANRSSPPSSGVMNPYPFASLNHLTVPVAIVLLPSRMNEGCWCLGSKYHLRQAQRRTARTNRNSSHLGAKRCFFKRRIRAVVKPDGRQIGFPLKNLLQSSNIGSSDPVSIPWTMANQQQDGSLLEAEKTRLKPPPLFKVLLLNDDYTPMDFVVVVLQTVFAMSREKATQVMLQVHREGMGVCGTYVREVAAAKVDQVIDIARKHQHPLQCTMEET